MATWREQLDQAQDWKGYRQALRTLRETAGIPFGKLPERSREIARRHPHLRSYDSTNTFSQLLDKRLPDMRPEWHKVELVVRICAEHHGVENTTALVQKWADAYRRCGGDPGERFPLRPHDDSTPTTLPTVRDAGVSQKRQSPFRRRAALTGCVVCLSVLAAGGVWLIDHHPDHPTPPPPTTTAARPTVAPLPSSPAKENAAAKRLREARDKKTTWKIGVKRNQPGLSEEVADNVWVGIEIDYARRITKALGIEEEPEFVEQGTSGRDKMLENDEADMFIGTYGISEARKKGTGGHTPVLFAGPYFKTRERIMMQASKGPHNAQIRGKSVQVNALVDLPADTRVCVVKDSTADIFITKEKKFTHVDRKSDYSLCTDELDTIYDAVLTDSVILQNYVERHPGEFVIASDPFGFPEFYGIGLRRDSFSLKAEVCKAMKDVEKEVLKPYRKLAGDEVILNEQMTECSPPLRP
ncbi:transporter substrate-binding domain-containing protein [Streptomyces sp. NPDC013012]|uniref:transporter substrate-binding domain-containing protein n=1 Tax=Streptomyces sp. NPDC013012 TaxID=3364860 RepID=UPI0036846E4B